MTDPETLDCQDCGSVIRVLTSAEADQVAANPYNYVVRCRACRSSRDAQAAR